MLTSADTQAISNTDLSKATVTFKGYTEVSFAEGDLPGIKLGEIAPIMRVLPDDELGTNSKR